MPNAARRKPRKKAEVADPLAEVITAAAELAEDAHVREWLGKLLAGDKATSETVGSKPRRKKK